MENRTCFISIENEKGEHKRSRDMEIMRNAPRYFKIATYHIDRGWNWSMPSKVWKDRKKKNLVKIGACCFSSRSLSPGQRWEISPFFPEAPSKPNDMRDIFNLEKKKKNHSSWIYKERGIGKLSEKECVFVCVCVCEVKIQIS